MTQYARPASDITTGWATAPLWSKIDEVSYSDADYITGTGPTKTAECKLSAVTDPLSSVSHTWRTRLRATGSSSGEKVTLSLYQGSTLIATLINGSTIARGSFADWSGTLTAAQADAITNYSDLRFRWVTGSGNGASETIDCSWAVLEVPDATQIYNENVSLSLSKMTDGLGNISISGGLSLAKSNSFADGNLGVANAVFSIQKLLSEYVADQSILSAIVFVSILRSISQSTSTVQTFDEAINLSKTLSQLVNNVGLVNAVASLSKTMGAFETLSNKLAPLILLNLAKSISEVVKVSSNPSIIQSKVLQASLQPKDIVAASLSFAKSSHVSLASEKLLISYISLEKSLAYSGIGKDMAYANLPLSMSFSYGLSGLLDALSSINLSKISQIVLIGSPSGQTIDASLILSKIQEVFTSGTLGIAIIYGSVIIMDAELIKVLVGDSEIHSVQVWDESV